MRLHSTQNDIMGKEPWNYSSITEGIVSDYLRLRHKLIPYLYTMSKRTHSEGKGLLEPLYYEYPQDIRAYKCKNSYLFGGNLIVAPITEKTDKNTLTASSVVFLPKGSWTDIFTGKVYKGDSIFSVNRDIKNIPVFAKEGSIIPLAEVNDNSTENPKTMRLLVYSGNGEFELYEDDGLSYNYKNGEFVTRKFVVSADNQHCKWKPAEIAVYKALLKLIDGTRCIYDTYNGRECMLERNRYMIDNSSVVIALFNSKPSGTKYTIDYAKKQGRNIIIINPENLQIQE